MNLEDGLEPMPDDMLERMREILGGWSPELDGHSPGSLGYINAWAEKAGGDIVADHQVGAGHMVVILDKITEGPAKELVEYVIQDSKPVGVWIEIYWLDEMTEEKTREILAREKEWLNQTVDEMGILATWKNRIMRRIYDVANFLGSLFR